MSQAQVGRRVLVADDSPLDFELLSEVLEPRGHAVTWARDGASALDEIKGGTYDVVLLDLHMPYMDGYDVIRKVRADPATRNLRVIVLTADAIEWVREEVMAGGASAYITKPIDLDDLIAQVEAEAPVEAPARRPWWHPVKSVR